LGWRKCGKVERVVLLVWELVLMFEGRVGSILLLCCWRTRRRRKRRGPKGLGGRKLERILRVGLEEESESGRLVDERHRVRLIVSWDRHFRC